MPPEQNNFNRAPQTPGETFGKLLWIIAGIVIIIAGIVVGGYYLYANKTTLQIPGTNQPDAPIVGGDKDEHGCIGSAGYQWCEAKQKCLRIWEEPCEATSTPAVKGTGQFCGGIAAFQCPTGYECKLDGSYPDAGGACQIAPAEKEPGTMCIQVITSARNIETGEIHDFPTPCDIPEGWEIVR